MREKRGRIVYFILIISLIFNVSSLQFSYAADSDSSNLLVNGGFETDIWSGEAWNIEPNNWNYLDINWYNYSDDEWLNGAEGDYGLKYWVKDTALRNGSFTIKQTVSSLEPGYYELSVESMGGSGDGAGQVQLFAGEQTSDVKKRMIIIIGRRLHCSLKLQKSLI